MKKTPSSRQPGLFQESLDILWGAAGFIIFACALEFASAVYPSGSIFSYIIPAVAIYYYSGLIGALIDVSGYNEYYLTLRNIHANAVKYGMVLLLIKGIQFSAVFVLAYTQQFMADAFLLEGLLSFLKTLDFLILALFAVLVYFLKYGRRFSLFPAKRSFAAGDIFFLIFLLAVERCLTVLPAVLGVHSPEVFLWFVFGWVVTQWISIVFILQMLICRNKEFHLRQREKKEIFFH